uniref:Secreted protein n=1 Tax=Caenorhabditis tropicalis TaxID=1561998 RepID=A0A1I7U9G3_9PELO
MLFLFWSPAAYVLSSVSSFSHAVSDVVCLQLDVPYQEGAITISSSFAFGNEYKYPTLSSNESRRNIDSDHVSNHVSFDVHSIIICEI